MPSAARRYKMPLQSSFGNFDAATDFFRRKLNIPTARWDDLRHGQHAHGFMVAGAMKMDLVNDFREAVDAAITNQETLAQFQARFDTIVAKHGWSYNGSRGWRSRIIFDTNIKTAIAAGRWQTIQDPDFKARHPYLRYDHNSILNPREVHQAWDGKIYAVDDPWWDTHFAPNGFGCNCSETSISERQLKKLGRTGPDVAPEGTDGIQPGWEYNVGKASQSMGAANHLGQTVMGMPTGLRNATLADAAQHGAEFTRDFAGLVQDVANTISGPVPHRYSNRTTPAGFLLPDVVEALEARGKYLSTSLIATTDKRLAHVMRNAKQVRGQGLSQAQVVAIPDILRAPDAVLFDITNDTLLYVRAVNGSQYVKVVVPIDIKMGNSALPKVHANWVNSAGVVDYTALREPNYKILRGRI